MDIKKVLQQADERPHEISKGKDIVGAFADDGFKFKPTKPKSFYTKKRKKKK